MAKWQKRVKGKGCKVKNANRIHKMLSESQIQLK